MTELVACPFCREMFERHEAERCPACGLALTALTRLPASPDAEAEEDPTPPHMEVLPFSYAARGRGLLVSLTVLGIGLFFAPWAVEHAPEDRVLTGLDFARRLGWMWAPGVAWFVMLPLVLSRRSIYRMRGARVAVAFLAGIVVMTVAVRMLFLPASSPLRPVRVEWAWGLFATGAVGAAALAVASRFGGRVDDVPTTARRPEHETLH
jgi:hypothetical protein